MTIHIGGTATGCNINEAENVTQVTVVSSDAAVSTTVSKTKRQKDKKVGTASGDISGMNISVGGSKVSQVIITSD